LPIWGLDIGIIESSISCMFHPSNPLVDGCSFVLVLDRPICAAASPHKRLQASLRSQIPL
jgi:hypothetical protein